MSLLAELARLGVGGAILEGLGAVGCVVIAACVVLAFVAFGV